MEHRGNYYRCSRPVLLDPAEFPPIPLVEFHSGGSGDGQAQVSLMNLRVNIIEFDIIKGRNLEKDLKFYYIDP